MCCLQVVQGTTLNMRGDTNVETSRRQRVTKSDTGHKALLLGVSLKSSEKSIRCRHHAKHLLASEKNVNIFHWLAGKHSLGPSLFFLRLYLCGFIEDLLQQTVLAIQGRGAKGFLEMYFMVQYQGVTFILEGLPRENRDAVGVILLFSHIRLMVLN